MKTFRKKALPYPILVKEHRRLTLQFNTLMRNAIDNEKTMKRVQAIELLLIQAGELPVLLNCILHQIKEEFQLDTVTLTLLDTDDSIRQLLLELDISLSALEGLQLWQDVYLLMSSAFSEMWTPVLGTLTPRLQPFFMPLTPETFSGSVALLPLCRQNQLIGCLGLASTRAEAYLPSMGTAFIERLASVMAICLENVFNRERLRQLGLTDPLTRIHNRRYFDQRLMEETARAFRGQTPLSCLCLDVDHFKQVNDSLGHPMGDVVLKELAVRIKEQLRVTDVFARYGGEEFVILLMADLRLALVIAERIRRAIAMKPIMLENGKRPLSMTLSVGVAQLQTHHPHLSIEESMRFLMRDADAALYQAKAQGRNRVVSAALPDSTWFHEDSSCAHPALGSF